MERSPFDTVSNAPAGVSVAGRLTRRSALQRLLGGSALALLAACSPATPAAPTAAPAAPTAAPKPAATTAPASTAASAPATAAPAPTTAAASAPTAVPKPAEQPKSGGTLRVGRIGDLTGLDAHLLTVATTASIWTVYETLTRFDDNLKPQPVLAESWDVSTDNKQVKLNLRKGVQFHSGREFVSDDVKYSILRVRDPKVAAAQLAAQSAWFTDIQTPDKSTVVLVSDKPRPGMFDFLEYLNIVDKETVEGPDAARKANGTGPFKLVEWAQGSALRLAKNAQYWRSGRPYLDGVTFQIFSDSQSMDVQLEAGALDAAYTPPNRDAVRLQKTPGYSLVRSDVAAGSHLIMAFNTGIAPTDNKQVRQALSFAVDRKRFVDTVLLGVGKPISLPWPESSPAYDAARVDAFAFDLDKAKSLLAASGIPDPDVDMIYTAGNDEQAALGQIFQADAAKIGAKVTLKPLEPVAVRDNLDNVKYRGIAVNTAGYNHLSEASSMFTTGRVWNYSVNVAGFKNPRWGELVDQAGTEPDPAKRKQLYTQINDFILDQAMIVPITLLPTTFIVRNNVHGLGFDRVGPVFRDTWLG